MADIILDREILLYISNISDALFPYTELAERTDTIIIGEDEAESGIVSGTLSLEEIIAENNIIFGQCISNKFECELFNISEDLSGKTLYVIAKENNATIPLFKGTIDESKTDAFSYEKKLVAYDEFYYKRNTNVADWWNTFWSTRQFAQLKDIRNGLVDYVGLPYNESTVLPNDSRIIKKGQEFTTITFTDLLKMICELQGCFPNIDRIGFLEYIELGSNETIQSLTNRYEQNSAVFETYTTERITGIQVYSDESSLTQTIGNDSNPYSIGGNIFLLNMTSSEITDCCNDLLNAIQYISYNPSTIPMIVSDFDVFVGDEVASENNVHYVLSNTYSGSLLVEQKIESKAQGQFLQKKIVGVNNEIITGRKFSKIEQDIDHISTQVQNVQDNSINRSEFNQTVDGINAQVQSIEKQIEGSIAVYDVTEEPTLDNFPAMDFTFSFPLDGTFQLTDESRFEYKDEWYRKFLRTIAFNSVTNQTYKFAYDSDTESFYWLPATDTEFGIAMEKIAKLEVTTEGITTEVSETKKVLNAQGTELEKNSSAITQNAKNISLNVSNKKGSATISVSITDDLTGETTTKSAQVNINADTINLTANQIISLMAGGQLKLGGQSGITIESPNFSVNQNGDASFKGNIQSGSAVSGATIKSNERTSLDDDVVGIYSDNNGFDFCWIEENEHYEEVVGHFKLYNSGSIKITLDGQLIFSSDASERYQGMNIGKHVYIPNLVVDNLLLNDDDVLATMSFLKNKVTSLEQRIETLEKYIK